MGGDAVCNVEPKLLKAGNRKAGSRNQVNKRGYK